MNLWHLLNYRSQERGIEQSDLQLIELTSASEVPHDFRNSIMDTATLTLDETKMIG